MSPSPPIDPIDPSDPEPWDASAEPVSLAYASRERSYRDGENLRLRTVQGLAAVFLVLSGMLSWHIYRVWPILLASLILTFLLQRSPSTRATGKVTEVLSIALVVIFTLNGLGIAFLFPYKGLIALLLLTSALWHENGLRRAYIKRGLFPSSIPLSSAIALSFASLAIIGSFFYHGELRLPDLPLGLLMPMGLVGCVLNAASEEVIYRGFLLSRLERAVGPGAAVLIQGFIFFIAHLCWMKNPLGFSVLLLFLAFGIVMGWLVQRTRGLLAAIFVHFWVDLTLFVIVLFRR